MFKKGDYIVLTGSSLRIENDKNFPLNFCYQQKINSPEISVYKDALEIVNGWGMHPFNKSKSNNWRYATPQEIAEYDRLGKPFDVTTLTQGLNYEIY